MKIQVGEAWQPEHQEALGDLKSALTSAPTLAFPQYGSPFILEVDGSDRGLGAVLTQEQDGQKRIIAYASRGLRRGECNKANYSSKKLEFLAMKWAITDKFRDMLLGAKFTVLTDSNPLTYLLKTKKLTALEQRWANALASFDFDMKYRPGVTNVGADVLSRRGHREV